LLSTEAEVGDRVRGLSTGADAYVGKPYDPGYVVSKASQLMRRASIDRQHDQQTVLLIDDSVTFREVLKAALEQVSFRVIVAGSGEEGLRIAADIRPNALVVDGILPGIDGPTVIRRIRLDAALRELPCFLLTGTENYEAEVQALEAGADAFARKGDNIGVVLARIQAMVRTSGDRLPAADTASLQGPKKILAVDDSETYLQQLAEALRADGNEVILARSGEQALELLSVEPVDCILLDLMMPGMGGQETCQRIKSAPGIRDIPVIMLTAVEDREAMISGLGAGADDYIAKSSDFEVVRARALAQIRRKGFEDEYRFSREHQRAALEVQLERLNLLGEITRAVAARYDLESIYQVVLNSVEEQLPVDFACVLVTGEPKGNFPIFAGARSRLVADRLAELQGSLSALLPWGETWQSSCPTLAYEPDINDAPTALSRELAKDGLRSFTISSLVAGDGVFAVLIAARSTANAFSTTDCNFLRQLSEHMSLAVNQAKLHQNLQQAYDDLRLSQQTVMQQERLRAIGQMASGIAHDINNAMTPLAVLTQRFLESAKQFDPEVLGYLKVAKLVSDDVSATVDRMREFYREREPQVELKQVDLNVLIDQVIELTKARWSDMAHRSGIAIDVRRDLFAELPPVMGIESEIREALTNLVFNAVDAMPDGGTLTLRTYRRTSGGENERISLEVCDTGVGMDEKTLRQCIEPFFTTKGERGTGLGLAMVHGVAKRHDAALEIESVSGQGTIFRLDFAASSAAWSLSQTEQDKPDAIEALKVLLVDDDSFVLEVMQATLESEGHVVIAASGGSEALELFKSALESPEPIDVVITDLGMPNMNGVEVARALKALSDSIPIILLSGWGRRIVADEDKSAHFDFTLSKPPRLPELRAALAGCVRPRAPTYPTDARGKPTLARAANF
jgi:DNA-binding response OmpR family regulator/signal transduction histidine kinase